MDKNLNNFNILYLLFIFFTNINNYYIFIYIFKDFCMDNNTCILKGRNNEIICTYLTIYESIIISINYYFYKYIRKSNNIKLNG